MRNLKLIVLLTAMMTIRLTAFTQTSSSDSVKCFTYEQARQIAKAIKHGEICDSISQNQALQIFNFIEVVKKDNAIILLNKDRISELEKDLKITNTKLKISKKLTMFGIPIAFGGGFLVGILLK